MYDCLMRRNIYSSESGCTCKSKHMVIFIYGSANCTQTVMAVRKHIGYGELLQPRSPCGLDYTDICYIMACQLIKFDLQFVIIARCVVTGKNAVSYGVLCSFLCRDRRTLCDPAVFQERSFVMKFDHSGPPIKKGTISSPLKPFNCCRIRSEIEVHIKGIVNVAVDNAVYLLLGNIYIYINALDV